MTNTLTSKTLIMIVGPSVIGKTTVMDTVTNLDDRFGYVKSFTTRKQRKSENSHYRFIDKEEALELLSTGEALTAIEHPTTHELYGTTADSYPSQFDMLDTLAKSVAEYQALDFQNTVVVSLTAHPDDWHRWFLNRYPEPSPEATLRLQEAEESIRWSMSHDTYWVVNSAEHIEEPARQLIAIAITPPVTTTTPPHALAILTLIKNGVWR